MVIPQNLKQEFLKIIEVGDEAKAREFLIANLKQFPQETQDAIIVAFVEETLAKKKADDALVSNFRKQGLEAASVLKKGEQELKKQVKLAEIKEGI